MGLLKALLRCVRLLGALVFVVLSVPATAQTPYLVKDINATTSSDGSESKNLVAIGGITYFVATTPEHGTELWKSDGTEAGTEIVKDIVPGTGFGFPQSLTALGSTLYFVASSGLWKSDGTAAGTLMVKDIIGGQLLTAVGSTLYFVAYDGVTGYELWKSDGTAAGTMMVKDVRPGVDNGNVLLLTAVGSTLYFTANDGVNGQELWQSDGTAAGTVMHLPRRERWVSHFPYRRGQHALLLGQQRSQW
jgi:ELWxxDGT repeat protein